MAQGAAPAHSEVDILLLLYVAGDDGAGGGSGAQGGLLLLLSVAGDNNAGGGSSAQWWLAFVSRFGNDFWKGRKGRACSVKSPVLSH
jgi:hypothetical protein